MVALHRFAIPHRPRVLANDRLLHEHWARRQRADRDVQDRRGGRNGLRHGPRAWLRYASALGDHSRRERRNMYDSARVDMRVNSSQPVES